MNLLRHKGQVDQRVVLREDNGALAGYQIHHWDGRVDARVLAPRIRMTTSIEYAKVDSGLLIPKERR